MICQPCRKRTHAGCESVSCCCGHQGSPVRPLTTAERHAYTQGNGGPIVKPRENGTSQ